MKPKNQNYKLINSKKLTSNVFELIFEWKDEINLIPGQFITFLVPRVWARAYSILDKKWKNISFIIKKIELEEWWKWWSKYICELKNWDILKWIWPSWNFILKENNKNKLFLWTWTGFVPLFNMINYALLNNYSWNLKFIFWVRTFSDMFYLEKLKKLKENYNNFSFDIYLSREEKQGFKKWYITEFISKTTKNNFEETYICWSPKMVNEAKSILSENWFSLENIFSESY